jgi:hypothetical protein
MEMENTIERQEVNEIAKKLSMDTGWKMKTTMLQLVSLTLILRFLFLTCCDLGDFRKCILDMLWRFKCLFFFWRVCRCKK